MSAPTPDWDPDNPLARMKGETTRQNQALNDYAGMGGGRSLAKLRESYRNQKDTGTTPNPPTTTERTLKTWSTGNHWQARIAAWTAHETERERQRWAERTRQARERNWQAADAALAAIVETLTEQAPRLLRSSRREVRHDTLGRSD